MDAKIAFVIIIVFTIVVLISFCKELDYTVEHTSHTKPDDHRKIFGP